MWRLRPELVYVISGMLTCRLESRELILNAGDILLLNPNQLHGFFDYSEDYRFVKVLFSPEAIAMPDTHIF